MLEKIFVGGKKVIKEYGTLVVSVEETFYTYHQGH
ncbi:hypothetical protein J2S74_000727 [Evansella vedderi]|uniref:Uncharacterized protein n=1 Tax=Evansella vedderi TaxID=38282 RepID=A0ABT9ZQX5_9BACI|nr:hypothetical protein [Evansella vedderi]